jgi:DNA primase
MRDSINTQEIKNSIDLRQWVEKDMGRPVSSSGSAWSWKCPFHSERHGAALAVWSDGWRCFGACDTSGDLFDWIAKWNNLDLKRDFKRIIEIAGGQVEQPRRESPRQREDHPPAREWQAVAGEIVERAAANLWTENGLAGLTWLRLRGLSDEVIRAAQLGYVNDAQHRWHQFNGMLIAANSITIPWYADQNLWGVRCRRLDPRDHGDRYKNIRAATDEDIQRLGKSHLGTALYWADRVELRRPVIVVEGEFNALAVWQVASDLVCPVSLGPAGAALHPRWFGHMVTATQLLARFDADGAGDKGSKRLKMLAGGVRFLTMPEGFKDTGDMLKADPAALRQWIELALLDIAPAQVSTQVSTATPVPASTPAFDYEAHFTQWCGRNRANWIKKVHRAYLSIKQPQRPDFEAGLPQDLFEALQTWKAQCGTAQPDEDDTPPSAPAQTALFDVAQTTYY